MIGIFHDRGLMESVADRIYEMSAGRGVELTELKTFFYGHSA